MTFASLQCTQCIVLTVYMHQHVQVLDISLCSMENTKRSAGRAGGLCCQMKNMNFPWAGELHRRAVRQAALQDGPAGCTLRRAAGLHIKLGCRKRRAFSATCRIAFLCSPQARPLSFVQPAESSRFSFGNTALQLVLSVYYALISLIILN